MVRYIKCPRCELNYINAEEQEYCDICLKELKGIPVDLDIIEDEDDLLTERCPICGENMMMSGDEMCEECRKKADYDDEEPDLDQDDEEWRNYLDDDADIGLDEDIEIDESFDEEFDEEEEDDMYHHEEEEEDLDYVTGDEIYSLSGDEDDEDDEDGEDDF